MSTLINLLQRSISGLFFLIIVVGMLYIGSITFFMLSTIIIALSIYEFSKLIKGYNINISFGYVLIIALTLFTLSFFDMLKTIDKKWYFILLIPLIFFLFVSELYRYHKKPFHNIAFSLLAIIYIAVPIAMLNRFVFVEREDLLNYNFTDIFNYEGFLSDTMFFNPNRTVIYTPLIVLGYFSIIWIYDTFAYLVGISFGKHRLFERISPKKSWEGAIGGTIITLGLTFLFPKVFQILNWYNWLTIAAITIFSSTMGDLVESLLKRSLDVKDSGNIIPGHGGILDRFDSVFLSAPFIFLYLLLIL